MGAIFGDVQLEVIKPPVRARVGAFGCAGIGGCEGCAMWCMACVLRCECAVATTVCARVQTKHGVPCSLPVRRWGVS